MTIPASLQTIAEISLAFAGFSGLVMALRKNKGPLTDIQKLRLRMLLLLAFGAMVMALLPEVVFYLGASPERLWAWCSSVFALYAASFLATWSVLNWRIASNAPEIVHWMAFSRMFAGHVIVLLLLLGVVFSLIDEAAAGTYLLALVWYLVHAAQQFSRMLFIQPRSEDVQPNAS